MKTSKLFLSGIFLFLFSFSQAQVSVNVNIGKPPSWGPRITTEEYYFLPDINSYYDIRQSQFIYLNNGVWIRSGSLPRSYRSYNLNTGNVVIINDYQGQKPYKYYKNHKEKYYNSNNNWEKSKGNGNNGKGNKKKNH